MLVLLPVDELVAVTDKLIVDVVESVPLSEPVSDGNAPLVIDEVGVLEIDLESEVVELGVVLEVEVVDAVPLPVADIEAVALALIVDDDVIVGVMVALSETDGVLLALPPMLRVLDGVADFVEERLIVVDPLSLPVGVCVGVCDDVLVPLPVAEPVPLTDALIVDVDESVPESLPLNDGPAPLVTDAVGECEIDLDKLIVVVGDVLDVGVPVAVPLPVDVPLEVIVDDIEIESEPLKLAPRVGDED